MTAFRKLKDQYEVVGVVQPDIEWRKKRSNGWFKQPCLRPADPHRNNVTLPSEGFSRGENR